MKAGEVNNKTGKYLKLPAQNPITREKVGKAVHEMLNGSFLTRQRFTRALPFIIFLMVLGVIYISNIFYVEKTKRQLDDLEEELRELRYEYVTSRSNLMYESKPSAMVEKLKETGIGETLKPPQKVRVSENETKR
jgi:hypothetical protein